MSKIKVKIENNKILKFYVLALSVFMLSASFDNDTDSTKEYVEKPIVKEDVNARVYVFDIKENIAPAAWRLTQKAFSEAMAWRADYIIIQMNTYGGLVNMADSIRTKILNSPIPVFIFIDNNAASAGALISIAADSVYMRKGASIGAATVVNQTGEVVPDKYQSYMRATMRSTAEAHGKDTIIKGNDTIVKWRRDPNIAEAMVDPSIYIKGVIDTGKVLTFTTIEAMQHGFCEGMAENITEVLEKAGIENSEINYHTKSKLDKVIGFLMNPILQGILLILIIGGIYFELQTPGIGFPLAAAGFAAIFYFAPLYLEGLAENWELMIFIIGIILLIIEIFAIPGFGIAGISGIILMFVGLTLSMIDNIVFTMDSKIAFAEISRAFATVVISFGTSIFLSIYISRRVYSSSGGIFSTMALNSEEKSSDGFIGVDMSYKKMVGRTGVAQTVLRPSGRVEIDGELYDAVSEIGFIEKGEPVKVLRHETGQLHVIKI